MIVSALWEGDDRRFGHALWQSLDAMVAGSITAGAMKLAFSRSRLSRIDGPNLWFQGRSNTSFPGAEVTEITRAVTLSVLEDGTIHPAVWALELLPLYDGVARVKSQAHWQSDVLASFAIGTAVSAYMQSGSSSFAVGLWPRGLTIA